MLFSTDVFSFNATSFGLVLLALLFAQYAIAAAHHVKAHSKKNEGQLPPRYPVLVPFVGAIIPFLLNGGTFVRRVTSFKGKVTSGRVLFWPGWEIFFLQDPQTIKHVWKQSHSFSNIKVRLFAYKFMFGLPEKGLSIIAADDSGPLPTPDPRSAYTTGPRIHHLMHDSNHRALTGPGLGPLQQRFKGIFISQMEDLAASSEDWVDVPDLRRFVHIAIGLPTIQAIFGPAFVRLNPDFMDNLYDFNSKKNWLFKGMPEVLMPEPYALRRKLHDAFKRWYKYARQHFDETKIDADGDGDSSWGSFWMRQRQERLTPIQDDDSLAALDLGVAFGAIENTVNCAFMALFHIIEDDSLLGQVRQEVSSVIGEKSLMEVDTKQLSANPLLASIYAETLRLYVSAYTIIYSPRNDVPLGQWWLPQGKTGLVNSELAHMNEECWNTKDGAHPLDTFWPGRFIVDPADPSSGPRKPNMHGNGMAKDLHRKEFLDGKPYFSMDGLEASWIPYGGGRLTCPGRFMARNAITTTCAFMTRAFDIEVLSSSTEIDANGFGLGFRKPKHAIACRLRRRSQA